MALSGSLVLLVVFPWILKFSFRGTSLTLLRMARAIMYPVSVCLAGVGASELMLRLVAHKGIGSQLLVTALGFVGGIIILDALTRGTGRDHVA